MLRFNAQYGTQLMPRPALLSHFFYSITAVLLAIPSSCALAWGPVGHRIVAALAERRLTAQAQQQVRELLGADHDTNLPDIANWADEIRNDPNQKALFDATKRWHYINFPTGDCHLVPPRDCPDGQCVVAAIERYTAVLGDRSQSPPTRREALKFLVHFVGDVHQPLHAGRGDDKGGNMFQINYRSEGWNLHSVWDSLLIESHSTDWRSYADELAKTKSSTSVKTPTDWAIESCRLIAEKRIYPERHSIDDGYLKRLRPIAEQRLREAGDRLAAVLNTALK